MLEPSGSSISSAAGLPAISVIIPVFNGEKYLQETLLSIQQQTMENFEVIVVNDGSTDKTGDIASQFAEGDSRFKLIKQDNKGAGIARNVGLAEANGEYLLFFDSDDVMHTDMLETMVNAAHKFNADALVCRARTFHSENSDGASNQKIFEDSNWGPHGVDFLTPYKGIELPESPFFTTIGWSWDKLFKTSFILKMALKFQDLTSTNDALFVFVGLALAERIVFIEDYLVDHRMRTGSVSTASRNAAPHNAKAAYLGIKEKLREHPKAYAMLDTAITNWGLNHLRWNYRTLEDEARIEAFKDYLELLSETQAIPNFCYHDEEEEWVLEAFQTLALNCEPSASAPGIPLGIEPAILMKIADLAIDLGLEKRKSADLIHQRDCVANSLSFKIGRAVTCIPRKLRGN